MRLKMTSVTQQQWLFGLISFALTVPNTYLLLGLPLLMRQYNWSGTEIGLFQLAALPAAFKFLLAIPIQYYQLGRKHYCNWLLILMVVLIILLAILAVNSWIDQPLWLFVLVFMTLFLISWIDIPLNALLVKLIPHDQQLYSGSIRSISLFLGAIFGSGIMLTVQYHWGWSAPFLIIIFTLLLSLLIIKFIPETEAKHIPQAQLRMRQVMHDWQSFFNQPGSLRWILFLLTCFPTVAAVWIYQKPFLLDQGMAANHVAWIIGVGGGIVGSLFSLMGNKIMNYLSINKILPLCIGWAMITLTMLWLSIIFSLSINYLIISLFLIASSMGIASTLFIGLMFNFTRQTKRASDYGLQASLFVIARILIPIIAGVMLDLGGYQLMLGCLALIMLGLFIFSVLTYQQQISK